MKNNYLEGKNILYIDTNLFGYYEDIIKVMRNAGANVDFISSSFLPYKETLAVKLGMAEGPKENYYRKVLKKFNFNSFYDYIWIKPAESIPHFFLTSLKNKFPKAIFISYHWHPIKNKNISFLRNYFDKIFCFDQATCAQYDFINYLPLFYTDEFVDIRNKRNESFKKFDLVFVGNALIKERNIFLKKIEEQCKNLDLNCKFYLFASHKIFLKMLLKGKIVQNNTFKKLNRKEIADLFLHSNCIVDYANPDQTGLTMRTFEALGSGAKLITTNQSIMNEPIYDNQYINVIDKNNPIIDTEFIKKQDYSIPDLIKNYSIHEWTKTFFI